MSKVLVSKSINVSANAAWEKLGSFRGIENYSPIARSITNGDGVGATRTCYMPDDAAIHEELTAFNAEKREFEYIITEGPFPVTAYKSNVAVKELDSNNCEITWGCTFESAAEAETEMKNLFAGFYDIIIDSLEQNIKSEN